MKKDFYTFLGVFLAVFLTTNGVLAQSSPIIEQAGKIIDRLKPVVFIGAALYLVFIGVNGIISGGDEAKGSKLWGKIGGLALALGLFLIAGAVVNLFLDSTDVGFLDTAQ
ncbi:MAG: hypothetical protein ACTSXL_01880 [Alphaproteobacteria bacterium]|nr:MAG: hypothetical protein B6I23_01500 [Rickettsiaceae bacterium 4572_127]